MGHVKIIWSVSDCCMFVRSGWNDHLSNSETLCHPILPCLFSSCALSILTTLDRDPVTDLLKRDWLQERSGFCFPSHPLPSLCLAVFSIALPPSFAVTASRLSPSNFVSHFFPPVFIFSSVESNLKMPSYVFYIYKYQTWKQDEAQRSKIYSFKLFYCGFRCAHVTSSSTSIFGR